MMGRSAALRLGESNHGIFYAPLYSALQLGFFKAEGVDVEFSTAADGPDIAQRLLRDEVDIGRAGPIRTLIMAERGHRLLSIAEVNARAGFYLLSRRPIPSPPPWRELQGTTFITWREPQIPWLCTEHVLRKAGVDAADVRVLRLPADEMVEVFRRTPASCVTQFQPETEQLLADGTAQGVVAMAAVVGPIPFSSFVVTPRFLEKEGERIARFLRGFQRALSWVHSASAGDIASAITPFFPHIEQPWLERSVARYLADRTWPTDAVLRQQGFEYLQEIVLVGGVITRRHRYEDHVDTEFANRAAGQA
jgi:NitT/TauT family transport system substrate-binding protein